MKKLNTYIGWHVLGAMLVVLISLTVLHSLFTLLAQLGDMRADYQLLQVLKYIALTTPKRLIEVLPVSAMIGCIVGLGILAGHSELVVIRASGVSLGQIALAVIKPAFVLIISGALISEFIVPALELKAKMERSIERSHSGRYANNNLWWREGNQFIYIDNVKSNCLERVDLFCFNKQYRLHSVTHAKSAVNEKGNWVLKNLSTTVYNHDGEKLIKTVKDSEKWDVDLDSNLLKLAAADVDSLSVRSLFTYIQHMEGQHLDARLYKLAFYTRLFEPFTVITLVLVGMAFLFGPLRTVTMSFRLFMGIGVSVFFMMLQNLIKPASILFDFHPAIAILMPGVLFLLLAGWLFRRIR